MTKAGWRCGLPDASFDVVLQPDALAFHWKFMAEAARFPDLAKLFIDRTRGRQMIVELLTTYRNRGVIEFADAAMAAATRAILKGEISTGPWP